MHTFLQSVFQGVAESLQDASFGSAEGFRSDKKGLAGRERRIFDIEMAAPIYKVHTVTR